MFLASPALSLSGLLGFGYIPNEKLALIMVLFNRFSRQKKFSNFIFFSLITGTVFFSLTYFQYLFQVNKVSVPAINTVLVILALPFYSSFINHNSQKVLKSIFIIGILQFLISIYQQFLMQLGYPDVVQIFNNYPPQRFYEFGRGEAGFFFRTSGLFTESSSYAVFQWIAVISGMSLGVHKNKMGKIILSLIAIELLTNGSITGFIFIILYFVFSIGFNFKIYSKIIIALFSVIIIVTQAYDIDYNLINIYFKVIGQFDFLIEEDSYYGHRGRLFGLFNAVEYILNSNYYLIGVGLSWISPTLDIFSLYLKAYGIIGFIFLMAYILFILKHARLNYAIAALGVLCINGHLSSAVNILLLSLCFLRVGSNNLFIGNKIKLSL
jgi:hypothetical protein